MKQQRISKAAQKREIVRQIQEATSQFYKDGGDGLTVGSMEFEMFSEFITFKIWEKTEDSGMWDGYRPLLSILTVEQWEKVLQNFKTYFETSIAELRAYLAANS